MVDLPPPTLGTHQPAYNPRPKKLARLPPNAKISKRPLHHPAIPSPYAGVHQQKVIYVSARTPFLSAIKRVEKLLHLSDKRLVQSATTLANHAGKGGKRKRGGRYEGDEVLGIATEVERLKAKRRKGGAGVLEGDGGEEAGVGEEVVLKGAGKAVGRCLELALWFQQREEYVVHLRTGSAGAIDDIEVDEDAEAEDTAVKPDRSEGATTGPSAEDADDTNVGAEDHGGVDPPTEDEKPDTVIAKHVLGPRAAEPDKEPIPETRIRYTSVLEVAVSLR